MADSMRSLNSFGVAGLLSATSEILYSNDLRARNIGRISDLLSAKLRDKDIDEMRFRALLTYGLFLAYAIRGEEPRHSEEVPAVSSEVGFDSAYLAVGISMHWEGNRSPKLTGLLERLSSQTGGDAFERILVRMEGHATQLIVRYEMKERRLEIVALVNHHDAGLKDPTMLIAVDSQTAPLLEVASYIELGDLDYAKLLKTSTLADDIDAEAADERVLVESDARTPQETVEELTPSQPAEPQEAVTVVGDSLADEAAEFRFTNNSSSAEVEELRAMLAEYEKTMIQMRGTISDLEARLGTDDALKVIKSSAEESDTTPVVVKTVKRKSEKVIEQEEVENSEEKSEDDWGLHFLKQVWPFAKKEEDAVTVVRGKTTGNENPESVKVSDLSGEDSESDSNESESESESETALIEKEALEELQTIASAKKTVKFEKVIEEISKEVGEGKAKKWSEGLSAELLQEKARLNELQKTLSKQIRQRELEFKTAELALKQELKRKEDALRQKEAALESKNDQIAQLNLAIERAGNATADKEQQQMKVRLDRAQRLAQVKEEEAKTLVSKMRDLENRLIIAQAKSQKSGELQAQEKAQTLEKKLEEYKRVNQRLMESLNTQKDKTSDKEVGDLRRKIDLLDRQLAESKRNMEKSNFRVRELQESERKMQADMARAVEENRNLRKNQTRGGSDSGGQAA